MTRSALVEEVARRVAADSGMSPIEPDLPPTSRQVARIVEHVEAAIFDTLAAGGRVSLIGFATFKVQRRADHSRPDPQNPSERVKVPAHNVVKFSPSERMRAAVR